MARTLEMKSLAEALKENDKAFVHIRGRVVGEVKSQTVNGQDGDWTKLRFQVEDESGRAGFEWCRPGGTVSAGDWIETVPGMADGKFGSAYVQEYNGTKKLVAWAGRIKKISPPQQAGAQSSAGAARSGPALPWRQAVSAWDSCWAAVASSPADPNTGGLAALELFKAVLGGRVSQPPATEREPEGEPAFDDSDVPF